MNSDIYAAFCTLLNDAALGYPIAWPNVKFTDTDDIYLQVEHFPNRGIDETLSGQQVISQGLFQVSVIGKQGDGVQKSVEIAEEVAAVFPKLTQIDVVRVSRVPYLLSQLTIDKGRTELPLTIEYSG